MLGGAGFQVLFVAVLLGARAIVVRFGWARVILCGQPCRIWRKFVASATDGSLPRHPWVTFVEAVIGFAFGSIARTAAGLLLWLSPALSRTLRPLIVALNGHPRPHGHGARHGCRREADPDPSPLGVSACP